MKSTGQARNADAGYAMAALLVALAVLAIVMTVVLPTWRHMVQREKEEELVFRGQQYVRAIRLFQTKYAGAYPPDIDTLVTQKFIRKKYKDPMVEDGEFQLLYAGTLLRVTLDPRSGTITRSGIGGAPAQGRGGAQAGQSTFTFDARSGAVTPGSAGGGVAGPRGGIVGVQSKNTNESIRLYNGRDHYNEWPFIYMPTTMGPGRGGMGGIRGVLGQPGSNVPGTSPIFGGPRGRGQGGPGGPGGSDQGGRGRGGRGGPGGQPFGPVSPGQRPSTPLGPGR